MRAPKLSLALGACLCAAAPGCTAIVVADLLADEIPCADPGDCAAGFGCVDGLCQSMPATGQVPVEGTIVGAAGGIVLGPDGVQLSIPAGALTDDVGFIIARASSTNVALGCAEQSAFFRVTPALDLAAAALLSIPVSDCPECVVCAMPSSGDGAWLALDEPSVAPSGAAAALVSETGVTVVAGVAQ